MQLCARGVLEHLPAPESAWGRLMRRQPLLNEEGKLALAHALNLQTKCIYCGFCQEACPVDAIVEVRSHRALARYLLATAFLFPRQACLSLFSHPGVHLCAHGCVRDFYTLAPC